MTQKDDKWAYFRPGYFPVQDDFVAPAMVCLTDNHGEKEANVQFILVKADCYQKAWEDALFISESDFQDASKVEDVANSLEPAESIELHALMAKFMKRGYLPLNKLKDEIQFMAIH